MPWWWPVIPFVFGSGGTFTIVWYLFTRRINKADQKKAAEKAVAEETAKERAEANRKEWLIVKTYRQQLGRLLFWIITELFALMESQGHTPVNGHLRDSWAGFSKAESDLKNFEDEQASSLHED